MDILTMEEAHDILRIDYDDQDANIIGPLVKAIPSYLQTTTGRTWTDDALIHPLAKTAAQFILQLWFCPTDKSTDQLKKTIDSLLTTLQAIGRNMDNG